MARRLDPIVAAYEAREKYAQGVRRIEGNIADEQQRFLALQSFAQSARSEFNALDTVLSSVPDQSGIADELLRGVAAKDIAAARQRAGAAGARKRATTTPREYQADISRATEDSVGDVARSIIRLDQTAEAPMTREQVSAVAQALDAKGLAKDLVADFLRSAGTRKAATAGAVGELSADQLEIQAKVDRAAEILQFGGPDGIVGGFEGEAIALRRKSKALTPGELFATEEDAYKAYLSMLDDGRATVEEIAVLYPAADAASAKKALATAQRVYNEAKASKAFRNDEKKFFSERYISQARRVSDMEAEVSRIRPQYQDPALEALRRGLVAQGVDPDDPYLEFLGKPMYEYAKRADALLEDVAGDELVAVTAQQTAISRLVDQYATTGREWTVDDLESQLGKNLTGDALVDGIGFALAYDKQLREGVDAPTQRELQTEKLERAAKVEEAQARDIKAREIFLAEEMAKRDALGESEVELMEAEIAAEAADMAAAEAEFAGAQFVPEEGAVAAAELAARARPRGGEDEEAIAAKARRAFALERTRGGSLADARAAADAVYETSQQAREASLRPARISRSSVAGAEQDVILETLPEGGFTYERTPEGYDIFFKGKPRGSATPGTREHSDIARILGDPTGPTRDPAPTISAAERDVNARMSRGGITPPSRPLVPEVFGSPAPDPAEVEVDALISGGRVTPFAPRTQAVESTPPKPPAAVASQRPSGSVRGVEGVAENVVEEVVENVVEAKAELTDDELLNFYGIGTN